MIIYNITFNVEDNVKQEWLDYMSEYMIPAMLESGLLHSAVLSELRLNEPQGTSYALQFQSNTPEDLKTFQKKELPGILNELSQKFEEQVVYFPTEMKIIKKFNRD